MDDERRERLYRALFRSERAMYERGYVGAVRDALDRCGKIDSIAHDGAGRRVPMRLVHLDERDDRDPDELVLVPRWIVEAAAREFQAFKGCERFSARLIQSAIVEMLIREEGYNTSASRDRQSAFEVAAEIWSAEYGRIGAGTVRESYYWVKKNNLL